MLKTAAGQQCADKSNFSQVHITIEQCSGVAKGSGPQRGATAGRAHQVRAPFEQSKLHHVSYEADGSVPEAGEAEPRQLARLSRQLHHAEAQFATRGM